MRQLVFSLLLMACATPLQPVQPPPPEDDPHAWLEGVTDPKALDWVRARNAESAQELTQKPEFAALEKEILDVLDSPAKIAMIEKHGTFFYNFWKDAQHPKGLWRRTTLDEYRKKQPQWENVLDLDALAAAEKEPWVWHGAQILRAGANAQAGGQRRALVSLSRGGADADVVREFDVADKRFVDGGFQLPEAKTTVAWIDHEAIYVATDFGPGTLTDSGYPRQVKRWQRGTPLSQAALVYEGKPTDLTVMAFYDDTPGFERHFVTRELAFYRSETFWLHPEPSGQHPQLQKIAVPEDAEVNAWRQWLVIQLRTPWTVAGHTWQAGDLLAANFETFLQGKPQISLIFHPDQGKSLSGYRATKNHILLNVLDHVKSLVLVATAPQEQAENWSLTPMPGAPPLTTITANGVDAQESDAFFLTVTGYLTPTSLLYGEVGKAPELLKQLPEFFDASGLEVTQHFVKSKDGTAIPYFQVAQKNLQLDGTHPTLLYGYGGFEISLTPGYSGGVGRAWLSHGGVYVVANIRGGGEYGPAWHQAALKQNRLRAYEDFAAVAEDLVARKVTSRPHLGIQGGSNGGLLVANMLALYPQLFGAVVCQVPLADMKRYSHLLAGASWMAEYGDPDKPEEWAYIQTFSPYHNLKTGVTYPPTLLLTSTRDDRVHPAHARKMMAKLQALGQNVRYYENIEGGHGGAANNSQAAHMSALAFTFLNQQLR